MQCFKLPLSLCKRIQSALTRFWWDPKAGTRGMSLISWNTMMKSKGDGGLGVRDIQSFNDALLAKVSWRIITSPSCLLARVLAGKYFPEQEFLQVKAPSACSHGWRGILIGRDLIKDQLGWAIGDGKNVQAWQDSWLYSDAKGCPMGPIPESEMDLKVADLLADQTGEWNEGKIENHFPLLAGTIKSIKPSKWGGSNKQIWLKQNSGNYSAKSGYYVALEKYHPEILAPQENSHDWIKDVWKIQMAPKQKLLLWKILHGALPVGEVLVARQVLPTSKCIRCDSSESILHLFYHCSYAQKVWELAPVTRAIVPLQVISFAAGWKAALKSTALPPVGLCKSPLAPWIISAIWTARNYQIFQKREFSAQETINKAICDAKEWEEAQSLATIKLQGVTGPRASPEADVICRSDAAWKEESNNAGLAFSFYDTRNERFFSHSDTSAFVISSLVAEGLAMRLAMECAINLQLRKVIFESDSLQLVTAIDRKANLSDLHGILSDIHSLSPFFDVVSFRFSRRENLTFEDGLAKQALRGFVSNQV